MPLITNLSELKEVLPKLYSTVSNTATLPNMDRSENRYIVPIIGNTLYQALLAAYAGNSLTATQLQLVKKIRLAAAAYATLDEIGLFVLTLQDSGARKIQQGGTEPVRAWEIQEMKNTLANMATDGMEQLLNYLFANKADFPTWTASENFTRLNQLLIKTGTDLNDQYTLFQPQRCFFIMRNIISDVQLLYIEKTIGKDLLIYLRDKEAPSDEEKNCISLLKKALAYYSVMKAAKNFSVSFSDNGFTILGEKTTASGDARYEQKSDMAMLQLKIEQLEGEGKSFLELAQYELVQWYKNAAAGVEYKAALEAGRLIGYVAPDDRTSGNENRKIYVFP